MANISLTLYTNSFFGSILMSPIQVGSLSVNNSITNISRLGIFKCNISHFIPVNNIHTSLQYNKFSRYALHQYQISLKKFKGNAKLFQLAYTLQRKSYLCIPRKGIRRPQSQFPHHVSVIDYIFPGSVQIFSQEYLFRIFRIVSLQCTFTFCHTFNQVLI